MNILPVCSAADVHLNYLDNLFYHHRWWPGPYRVLWPLRISAKNLQIVVVVFAQ